MPSALTRLPAATLEACQLTFLDRQPIEISRALQQHHDYCQALTRAGLQVVCLEADPQLPDSVFVEDCAIILDELAVLTSPGSAARRVEVSRIEPEIARLRPLQRISLPATLEGGDVLRIGRTLWAGISPRTNPEGIEALRLILQPYGYQVIPVPVRGCLHLKTGCTALDDDTLLINPAWVDTQPFQDFTLVSVPEDEPWAANTLRVGDGLYLSSSNPKTLEMVTGLGFDPRPVELSEFEKAEGGLTCLSLIFG